MLATTHAYKEGLTYEIYRPAFPRPRQSTWTPLPPYHGWFLDFAMRSGSGSRCYAPRAHHRPWRARLVVSNGMPCCGLRAVSYIRVLSKCRKFGDCRSIAMLQLASRWCRRSRDLEENSTKDSKLRVETAPVPTCFARSGGIERCSMKR